MALGNEAADEMAGLAAMEARVPASFRHKVARSKQMARLVHRRILRATLEAIAKEKRCGGRA
eukprot:5200893-Pyramimonas_sp.AAC.1